MSSANIRRFTGFRLVSYMQHTSADRKVRWDMHLLGRKLSSNDMEDLRMEAFYLSCQKSWIATPFPAHAPMCPYVTHLYLHEREKAASDNQRHALLSGKATLRQRYSMDMEAGSCVHALPCIYRQMFERASGSGQFGSVTPTTSPGHQHHHFG